MNILSNSLAARLTRRVLAIVALSFVSLLLILKVQYAMERDSLRDRALLAQAADIAAHISFAESGRPELSLPPSLDEAYDRPDRQYVFVLLDDAGRVLAGSHDFNSPLSVLPGDGDDPYFAFVDLAGRGTYYGVTAPVPGASPPLFVQVAQGSIHPDVLADSLVAEFLEQSWAFLLVLAVLIVAVTVWTVHQSLSPLTRLSAAARGIGPGSLDLRLPVGGLPEEMVPLVGAVNAALARIERGYAREREFTANAAHELRTPLAVLKAHIETLSGLDEVPQLVEELDGIERLVSQLLWLAQADALELMPGETADLREVATGVARLLGPRAVGEGRSLELTGAEAGSLVVRGNSDFLALALRNLVENALAHTPHGGTVEIRLRGGRVDVVDEGPGVTPGDERRIFERFVRLQPHAYGGAGLGLSIAARIAEVHGGRIEVAREPGRGASFSLILPPGDA
ncbi:MAG: sensor histidine kinase N-terminal domain-containing protein [Parvibaculum sp.]|uniref:sensor histidine kinase n=1 Tax=Parvibaculum sp. TaxID=2024848 RepID=UPI002612E9CD|nr:ATP-binding protein [Parvibaculum sp.]MBX3497024.1 sensor histidine kinase N-terminal domain-containing protein [Parvibaculum sp.]MCW5727023.1 sensor histidine kinase N-terminal domain-containing protein [Parvibaculum sp.]